MLLRRLGPAAATLLLASTATAAAMPVARAASSSFSCPISAPRPSTCVLVDVPVHHADPHGPVLQVAAARFAGRAARVGATPLVFLTGGPGGSGIADISGAPQLLSALAQDRDVIAVDPRGTGLAIPRLDCGPVDSGGPLRVRIARGCLTRLRAAGVPVEAFNTTESAADVVAILDALGVERADLLGASYGTRLALTVARDHPTRVQRMVLDGTFPAGASLFDQPNRSGARAIRRLLADRPGTARRFAALVRQLDRHPARIGGRRVTGSELATTVYDQLYADRTDPDRLEVLVARAVAGRPRRLAALIEEDPSPASAASAVGAYWAAECQEDAPFVSPASMRASGRGDVLAGALLRGFRSDYDACRTWALPGDQRARTPVSAAAPTLLLAGALDPVTPPEQAARAAATLTRAQIVRFPRAGHVVLAYPNCSLQLVSRFLSRLGGRVPASCANRR